MKVPANIKEILSEGPEWHDREERLKITPDRWGKDHWSLLVFVEEGTVDRKGKLDWRRMTLSARNWPMLWAARDAPRFAGHAPTPGRYTDMKGDAADKFGLRLKHVDGKPVILYGHCEGDALMDLVDAGLVTIAMPAASEDGESYLAPSGRPIPDKEAPVPADLTTGMVEWGLMPWARFSLTARGRSVANDLREHKSADGATWSNFTPTVMPIPKIVPGELSARELEA